ncbi:MAG: hypothetical protein DYG99_14725 [Bacteroidetes bacterium CHB5]|nr:hypothetical protein [Bacteroidetes bacterium CHB5]
MVTILEFFKRRDSLVASIFLILIIIGAFIRGYLYSSKINEESELCYGVIVHDGSKHFRYEFFVSDIKFEGNVSNKRAYKLGDTLIIQYFTKDPAYHVVHSKKKELSLKDITRRKIRFSEAF